MLEQYGLQQPESLDFSKIKLSSRKKLDDPILKLDDKYKGLSKKYSEKTFILDKMEKHDYNELRKISQFYYESSGIYQRLCKYMSFLYRYDWFITPYRISNSVKSEKIMSEFYKISQFRIL